LYSIPAVTTSVVVVTPSLLHKKSKKERAIIGRRTIRKIPILESSFWRTFSVFWKTYFEKHILQHIIYILKS